jgi:hypothetical protein
MFSVAPTISTAEAHADALVARLRRGRSDRASVLARLQASGRPYFTWALAWAGVTGALERDPGDDVSYAVLEVLRALEPAASWLDGQQLVSGSHATGS